MATGRPAGGSSPRSARMSPVSLVLSQRSVRRRSACSNRLIRYDAINDVHLQVHRHNEVALPHRRLNHLGASTAGSEGKSTKDGARSKRCPVFSGPRARWRGRGPAGLRYPSLTAASELAQEPSQQPKRRLRRGRRAANGERGGSRLAGSGRSSAGLHSFGLGSVHPGRQERRARLAVQSAQCLAGLPPGTGQPRTEP